MTADLLTSIFNKGENHSSTNGTAKLSIKEQLSKNANPLPRKIEFHKAKKPDIHTELLRAKYQPINASPGKTQTQGKKNITNTNSAKKEDEHEHDSNLKKPLYHICAEEKIWQLIPWKKIQKAGPGLDNLGNTCFLNSALQCLSYTPPLANYLLSREHSKSCKAPGFCMFCALEKHILRVFTQGSNGSIRPSEIVSNLRLISKQFRLGRQEDSHEFLRYVIEGMQKSSLYGIHDQIKKTDPRIAETTVVHRIFGGYLQSQVKCCVCDYKSNTFDPFLDLSLEIKNCISVEKALQAFTRVEVLDKENKYRCSKCSKYVQAQKQFTIRKVPNVLTLQLKRFSYTSMFGGKIQKPVAFPERLNLKPFVSATDDPQGPAHSTCMYSLYGVLVHSGDSTRSGHYYSFVKSPAGIWYSMNDSHVSQVSLQTVLSQKAYILFYVRDAPEIPKKAPKEQTQEAAQPSKNGSTTAAAVGEKNDITNDNNNNNNNSNNENANKKKKKKKQSVVVENQAKVDENSSKVVNNNPTAKPTRENVDKKENSVKTEGKLNQQQNPSMNGQESKKNKKKDFLEQVFQNKKDDEISTKTPKEETMEQSSIITAEQNQLSTDNNNSNKKKKRKAETVQVEKSDVKSDIIEGQKKEQSQKKVKVNPTSSPNLVEQEKQQRLKKMEERKNQQQKGNEISEKKQSPSIQTVATPSSTKKKQTTASLSNSDESGRESDDNSQQTTSSQSIATPAVVKKPVQEKSQAISTEKTEPAKLTTGDDVKPEEQPTKKKAPVVVTWDSSIENGRSGLSKKMQEQQSQEKRNTSVVQALTSHKKSLFGFAVPTWDSEENSSSSAAAAVDKSSSSSDKSNDAQSKKRKILEQLEDPTLGGLVQKKDQWNIEYDQGRVKKTKKQKMEEQAKKSRGKPIEEGNPFQRAQLNGNPKKAKVDLGKRTGKFQKGKGHFTRGKGMNKCNKQQKFKKHHKK